VLAVAANNRQPAGIANYQLGYRRVPKETNYFFSAYKELEGK